ncbi:DUF4298 domain-containing protein [Collinsella sp. AGMB00827]|uniref:DUF4298 domain-containing protein n=1 Tax=Collinsella ureilytica TaxID=2869515 RepID=A0ABS7MK35_9ACTN|nr:DUF4298 domain-containing protein [Collinsella urealyticum]
MSNYLHQIGAGHLGMLELWHNELDARLEGMVMKEDVICFERILDESNEVLDGVEAALDRLDANRENYQAFLEYYGSEAYMKDVEISDETDDYADIAHGVLSEDLPYDLVGRMFQTSIRMLELATTLIKER